MARLPRHPARSTCAPDSASALSPAEAVVGNIGAREWLNYTAIGDTVNLAQRLEEIAGGGEILIDERTRQVLDDAVRVEPRGLTLDPGPERAGGRLRRCWAWPKRRTHDPFS